MQRLTRNGVVFSNLNETSQVSNRLRPTETGLPGWFGYPIKRAGYDFRCDSRPFSELVLALWRGQQCVLLCFNPSLIYFLLFMLPLPVWRVSLFQWKPLCRLPPAKALAVRLTLMRSHEIVVYSHLSARYLRRIFPRKPIRQIGLFADEHFFTPPQLGETPAAPFILVPGDHKREERLLGEIAENLKLNVVRVTRNPQVRSAVEALSHERVDVRYDVSFEDLRTLYQTCSVVLILSDSSEIPTGITTLAEALSCGADVVISRGHSNSWPPKIAKALPFTVIPFEASADAVAGAIREQWRRGNKADRQSQARKFALDHLSTDVLTQEWKHILG